MFKKYLLNEPVNEMCIGEVSKTETVGSLLVRYGFKLGEGGKDLGEAHKILKMCNLVVFTKESE